MLLRATASRLDRRRITAEREPVTNAVDRNRTRTEASGQDFSWLEDYLEHLEGKEAWRDFQEGHYDSPEYYALLASLMA
jgi:hypothetical protein